MKKHQIEAIVLFTFVAVMLFVFANACDKKQLSDEQPPASQPQSVPLSDGDEFECSANLDAVCQCECNCNEQETSAQ